MRRHVHYIIIVTPIVECVKWVIGLAQVTRNYLVTKGMVATLSVFDMEKIKKFILDRYWFGWWYASYCSAHQEYNIECHTCQGGSWGRNTDDHRLFGKIIQNKK